MADLRKKTPRALTARQVLQLFVDRWERLQDEKEGLAEDQKDVLAEAKGFGVDPSTMREILKLGKGSPERETLIRSTAAALAVAKTEGDRR